MHNSYAIVHIFYKRCYLKLNLSLTNYRLRHLWLFFKYFRRDSITIPIFVEAHYDILQTDLTTYNTFCKILYFLLLLLSDKHVFSCIFKPLILLDSILGFIEKTETIDNSKTFKWWNNIRMSKTKFGKKKKKKLDAAVLKNYLAFPWMLLSDFKKMLPDINSEKDYLLFFCNCISKTNELLKNH